MTPPIVEAFRRVTYLPALKTVTRSEIAGLLNPIALRATTPKVYETPGVRPVISQEVVVVVQVRRSGNEVTRYPLIGSPPGKAGAFQFTVADSTPADAVTRLGLPGTLGSEITEMVPLPKFGT